MDATARFTKALPVQGDFREAFFSENYVDVPGDWFAAVTDVVASRQAIASGKFKAVNLAGVAAISAVMNALGHRDIPYVFGGDGSAMICAPEQEALVHDALARTVSWVADETGLELRAALVPVSVLSSAGHAIRVAAVQLSNAVNNFAFCGGGIDSAEKLMKSGDFLVERASPGQYPDLTGLSCRWMPVERERTKVVSLIVEPADGAGMLREDIATAIIAHISDGERPIHPLPADGPDFAWPPKGLDLEARATRGDQALIARKIAVLAEGLFGWFLGKTGWNAGSFDPNRYRRYTALNTDYRKVQDGLRLTVCLDQDRIAHLQAYLEDARSAGDIRYGISEQDQAVLTCFVPSVTDDDHLHFLDGAGGGYAEAASKLR